MVIPHDHQTSFDSQDSGEIVLDPISIGWWNSERNEAENTGYSWTDIKRVRCCGYQC